MPDRYTPGYTPPRDPGQPSDIDPRRVLLTTMWRLGDRSETMGLVNHHNRPFRYVLLARETGLPGETIRWHMKQLVNEGLVYEHRNGWGLQRRGVSIAARMLEDAATDDDDESTAPRLSPDLDVRDACGKVVGALWAVLLAKADEGADLEHVRFSLADVADGCPLGSADVQAILEVLHKRQIVRFDGGYAFTITGLRHAHRFNDDADVDELLERNFQAQRAARAALVQDRRPT